MRNQPASPTSRLSYPQALGFALLSIVFLLATIIILQGGSTTAVAAIPPQPISGGGTPTPIPTCGPIWRMEYGPNAGNKYNRLTAVDDLGSGSLWAVGYARDDGGYDLPVAQYWDGSQWTVTATAPVTESGYLLAVDALAPDNVWAVGYSTDGQGAKTLTMHWNGAQWSLVPSPNLSTYQFQDYLMGVTVIAPNDVWAVGYYKSSTQQNFDLQTLTLHWDGSSWQVVDSPNIIDTDDNVLTSISAVSANDIWAVGYYLDVYHRPLTMRWDGSAWTIIDTNVPDPYHYYLRSVSAYSANEVWAVGSYDEYPSRTFALQWNGTTWQRYNPPNPSNYLNDLYGVKVLAPGDVWAVGNYGTGSFGVDELTLTLHLTGGSWRIVPSPNGAAGENYLNAIAASSTGELWSVGTYPIGNVTHALTLRYPSDGCVTPTITATPTSIILPSRTPTPTQTPACGLSWHHIASSNTQSHINQLRDVSVISENDVWAVGTHRQHWDGNDWTIVPGSSVWGVSGVASNDVWAVGADSGYSTLTEHWDGTQWTRIPSPNIDTGYNFLVDVAAISANDVWAVGYGGFSPRVLVLHWNGIQWSIVPTPYPGDSDDHSQLESVHANAHNDVWAAGYYIDRDLSRSQYFVMRWDGASWTTSFAPTVGPDDFNRLYGIGSSGPDDVWAVGTAILHWDGTSWTKTPNPVADSELNGVVAFAPNDVWIVGATNDRLSADRETVVLHWNGTQWTRILSPNPDPYSSSFNSVAALGPNSIWAVGYTGRDLSGGDTRTLTERYYDPCWPVCPLQFTDVPPGSTFYTFVRCLACRGFVSGYWDGTFRPNDSVTRGQLSKIVSNAAGYTEPPSGRMFEDVPPGSTFYLYIQRLATRGHIGGYACGGPGEPCIPPDNRPYFRPGNNASRGQIAKIVSNAASLQDPPGEQIFEDVPPGSTFYDFVQRLANLAVMDGYLCGSPGEPCVPPGDRPYFRPNNNATRGQTSKIVSNTFFPGCDPAVRSSR